MFKFYLLLVYDVWVHHGLYGVCVEVRGYFCGVGSFLAYVGSRDGTQCSSLFKWQASLFTMPSCPSPILKFV